MLFYHIILAGGLGKRIWPISNSNTPKQFIKFTTHSFFQQTLLRHSIPNICAHYAVVNQSDFLLAQSQIIELDHQINYIIEPIRRNTAAACLLAAWQIYQHDPEAILCITPSDHCLSDVDQYHHLLQLAYKRAQKYRSFILLGAKPLYPSTDYGYLEYEPHTSQFHNILSFTEKPNQTKATKIYSHANYRWNMGIFILPVAEFIAKFAELDPTMLSQCQNALQRATHITQPNVTSPKTNDMLNIHSASIDQHFFTHCPNLQLLHYEGNWGDIGTWPGFIKHVPSQRAHLSDEIDDCHFYSADNKNIFALGVKNLCMIDTEEGILLANKQYLDQVPAMANQWRELIDTNDVISNTLDTATPSLNGDHNKDKLECTPWGTSQILSYFAGYKIKLLTIMPNEALSLQYHLHRCEHWFIIAGQAEAILGDKSLSLQQGSHLFIPNNTTHRARNIGVVPLQILEVQLGSYLEEDDIVRLEDQYGRPTISPQMKNTIPS